MTCRLAIVWPANTSRDEDIFVTFEGDETLPAKGPSLSIAASIYKGGLKIASLNEFLNFALQLEDDAALHYEQLAATMQSHGNTEVGELFAKLAGYSRLHFQAAKGRMTSSDVNLKVPSRTLWPENITPERTAVWAADPRLSRLDALKVALQGERRGYEFYYAVANTNSDPQITAVASRVEALRVALDAESAGLAYYQSVLDSTQDPEIKILAKEFVDEETLHVAELRRWLALPTGSRTNTAR